LLLIIRDDAIESRMNRHTLIITHSGDLHADLVVERLLARDAHVFRLNLDRFPADYQLDIRQIEGVATGIARHLPTNTEASIADIGAVWTRKSGDFSFLSDQYLGPQERAYAVAETKHILTSLLLNIDGYWMNHPMASQSAMWKGEQLHRAARLGFRVPPSLTTNDGDVVRRFRSEVGGDIIFKPLSSPSLGADDVDAVDRVVPSLATTLITDEHEDMLDALRELPGFFQQYIPKRYELRVTVIDDQVFAARIHSQDDERTRTDYRDFSAEIDYTIDKLPSEIERMCRDFVHSYGLKFGALDLIHTPEGEYVFLENNPAGQFLFVEQLVPELRMLDAVTDCLIDGAHRRA
jgi:glutathione synthase/RimK-type ligase-like ATP-grasp enzyme